MSGEKIFVKIKKKIILLFALLLAAAMLPLPAYAGEKGDKANSFRYKNGKAVTKSVGNGIISGNSDSDLLANIFSVSGNAWKKINGQYLNSNGQVIEGATAKGIDVSHNQGTIDWAKVKADGVEFAIIRCGYGMNQTDQDDSQWENNIKGCEENGIPYGVYIYSYADTTAKAKSEANHVLRLIKKCNKSYLKYPIYIDMEDDSILKNTTAAQRGKIASAFIKKITAAGYQAGVFSSKNWFENYLPASVFDQWNRWVAHWSSYCGYTGKYQMWQAASTGTVDGITGNVDINFAIKVPTLKKPSIKVKTSGKKKVKVTWKPKTSGVKCYIYYSRKKKSGYKKYAVVNAKKGKIIAKKKLKSGKKYYFKIRLGKKFNGRMIYSKYSAVRAVTVK